MQPQNIDSSITKLLTERLSCFNGRLLNRPLCLEVYQTIFNVLVDVFSMADVKLTNEALNLVAQMYYDCTSINSTQELDPSIFTMRADPQSISTMELGFLATAFTGTPFAPVFISEIRRRN